MADFLQDLRPSLNHQTHLVTMSPGPPIKRQRGSDPPRLPRGDEASPRPDGGTATGITTSSIIRLPSLVSETVVAGIATATGKGQIGGIVIVNAIAIAIGKDQIGEIGHRIVIATAPIKAEIGIDRIGMATGDATGLLIEVGGTRDGDEGDWVPFHSKWSSSSWSSATCDKASQTC